MAETNEKLDRILTLLENLTTRLDRLENPQLRQQTGPKIYTPL